MNIGITIALAHDLFSSGINQNAFYLALVFLKSKHNVKLLGWAGKDKKIKDAAAYKQLESINKDINLEMIDYLESPNYDWDVIFYVGATLSWDVIYTLKKKNLRTKFIHYQCGNQFVVDMEASIFGHHTNRFGSDPEAEVKKNNDDYPGTRVDSVWQVPQHIETGEHWAMHLKQTENVTVVPFVWDPIFLEKTFKELGYGICDKTKNFKKVAVMEPNLSVLKNFLIPLATAERVNKKIPLEKFKIIAGKHVLKRNPRAKQLMLKTELAQEGKLTAENRHPTPEILEKWAHLVISWQWTNPLNYLYLDIAWMGYPIIHNAHLCKDIGYYYEGNNTIQAEEQVIFAIENHGKDIDGYIKKNREIIKRYTKENSVLIEQYEMLLQDVVTDKFQRYEYDETRNFIYKK